MIILRKGKKTLEETNDIYGLIENLKTHIPDIPQATIAMLRQNAFQFCINGMKARLGNGYIIETK